MVKSHLKIVQQIQYGMITHALLILFNIYLLTHGTLAEDSYNLSSLVARMSNYYAIISLINGRRYHPNLFTEGGRYKILFI